MFEGFELTTIDTGEAQIRLRHGGSGPPLLLVHGNPQCHVMWHRIAPRLAEQFLGQIEVFFSGITWYLEQHPERSDRLLADAGPPSSKSR